MAEDPYEVLGLSRGASPQQISEAYRALVQIYHPDRYAEAPPRVKDEALRRMQAVNAAFQALGKPRSPSSAQRRSRTEKTQAPPPRRRSTPPNDRSSTTALTAVLYVDGSPNYHDPTVAPLGLDLRADPVRSVPDAKQCQTLDEELSRWFQRQTRNASMANKLMYAEWDDEQRALYTATVGCSEVLLDSVEKFSSPCAECRPR